MESLKDQTTGTDIFEKVDNCLTRYNLQWNKMVSCVTTDEAPSLTVSGVTTDGAPSLTVSGVTTDGAPSLTGKNVGALKKIEDKICENYPDYNLITIHCIIHQ